ncbi:hypothetical protein MKEN_01448100 [Mycena kentingensis (nom. inval.)]|nr:hypothetical protein MKEN_01448100 [Mycena kentingensis (nom. inval.)]
MVAEVPSFREHGQQTQRPCSGHTGAGSSPLTAVRAYGGASLSRARYCRVRQRCVAAAPYHVPVRTLFSCPHPEFQSRNTPSNCSPADANHRRRRTTAQRENFGAGELLAPSSMDADPPLYSRLLATTQPVCEPLRNFKINKTTTLETLYTYAVDALVEFPETSATGSVGHLFQMPSREGWYNPMRNFVYSLGLPKGKSKRGADITCSLFKDEDGNLLQCRSTHVTCQGSKICERADPVLFVPHVSASREGIEQSLAVTQADRNSVASTRVELQQKTLSYYVVLKRQGCGAPPHEPTTYWGVELEERSRDLALAAEIRRGHDPKPTCDGRLLFKYDATGNPFIACEHYNRQNNRDHLIDYNPTHGHYLTEYLEALFNEDSDAIADFEEDALYRTGSGPLASCRTVANNSSVKVNCLVEHRDGFGQLLVAKMVKSCCRCRFTMYEPLEEYRDECPWILVVCRGSHPHPVPLPTKTPPILRDAIFKLLLSIDYDLPDLTPRRLLRHATTVAFLKRELPHLDNPMLVDLHPSLGNRDHIRAYIVQVQKDVFPRGTGWDGLLYLKAQDELNRVAEDVYIRFAAEYPASSVASQGPEDDDEQPDAPFRIIVCMPREASAHLVEAKFLQSDISFRRISGLLEFELGGRNAQSGNIICYTRILLNRQTAAAHLFAFQLIHHLVFQDTQRQLQWRHIDAQSIHEEAGVLHFVMDQHGGQAKGFGQYLQWLCQNAPPKLDLHEPHRLLSSLDPYEQLRRVARYCVAHAIRNINKVKLAPEAEHVRALMKGLICMRHPDWDGTIARIQQEGGKPAADWVADKIRSKFAFPGLCWEKSFIPETIWQVGDTTSNIIEALHADANREGVSCTLVGGVKKGEHLDNLKLKTLWNFSGLGIRPSYKRGHASEAIQLSLRRKGQQQHRALAKADTRIDTHNKRLQKAHEAHLKAQHKYAMLRQTSANSQQLQRAMKARQRANDAYVSAVKASKDVVGTGSGKVGVLLPNPHDVGM